MRELLGVLVHAGSRKADANRSTERVDRVKQGHRMLFSDAYDINRDQQDDWFDPILHVDTKLFVDPFLIFLDEDPFWDDVHDVLIGHFDRAFKLLAAAGCKKSHLNYKGALALLAFPEPREFCLGYTARGTRGAGGGGGYAKKIAEAMCAAIGRGVNHLDHFEEVGIFHEGIGPDRISDITCTILKPKFIEYTQRVARKHDVRLVRQRLNAAGFDKRRTARAMSAEVELPKNATDDRPLLLVPKRFLRDLPVLNADDWFDSSEAAEIRREMSADVLASVSKRDIVDIARRNPDMVAAWVDAMEGRELHPYDLVADPAGVYRWHGDTSAFAQANPIKLEPPDSDEAFFTVVDEVVEQFKHYVEHRGGWKLLWNDSGKEKPEEAAQLVFQGLVSAYCAANNIDVNREVELGRGPVDFKFSNGYRYRALLEIKKLHNGKFWNGLDAQLPSYLTSDQCTDGWFLAVQYRGDGVSKTRRRDLPREVRNSADKHGLNLRYALVDARIKRSASKLKRRRT